MATGDADDFRDRLNSLIPARWASRDNAPLRDALLGGLSDALAGVYTLLGYCRAQTRIATSTTFWLDLTAFDFFGPRFLRRRNEADAQFRPRILAEILRPRQTRAAITRAVTDLTGLAPDLRELFNPHDCGAYGQQTFAYNTAGCYGSLSHPNEIFVTVRRGAPDVPNFAGAGAYGVVGCYSGGHDGIPVVEGYNGTLAGYGTGSVFAYLIPAPPFNAFTGMGAYVEGDRPASITDADIYRTVAETAAQGVVPWTRIVPA